MLNAFPMLSMHVTHLTTVNKQTANFDVSVYAFNANFTLCFLRYQFLFPNPGNIDCLQNERNCLCSHKNCCFLLIIFILICLLTVGILSSVSANKSKQLSGMGTRYLPLPPNSTVNWNVDSKIYDAVEFAFIYDEDKNFETVRIIPKSELIQSTTPNEYTGNKTQEMVTNEVNFKIIRHWPKTLPPVSGELECHTEHPPDSNSESKVTVVWEWSKLKQETHKENYFNIDCRSPQAYGKCDRKITSSEILESQGDMDIVTIGFCTEEEETRIRYSFDFHEHRAEIYQDTSSYVMGVNAGKSDHIVVPLANKKESTILYVEVNEAHENVRPSTVISVNYLSFKDERSRWYRGMTIVCAIISFLALICMLPLIIILLKHATIH